MESAAESLPVRECGLKSHCLPLFFGCHLVTPRAGVWIEIKMISIHLFPQSVTPRAGVWIEIWIVNIVMGCDCASLPVRECGLKSLFFIGITCLNSVTPRAGVWIEILLYIAISFHILVTPRAGVWIEIALILS